MQSGLFDVSSMNALLSTMGFASSPASLLSYSACSTPTHLGGPAGGGGLSSSMNPITMAYSVASSPYGGELGGGELVGLPSSAPSLLSGGGGAMDGGALPSVSASLVHQQLYQQQLALLQQHEAASGSGGSAHAVAGLPHFFPLNSPSHHATSALGLGGPPSLSSPSAVSGLASVCGASDGFIFPAHVADRWRGSASALPLGAPPASSQSVAAATLSTSSSSASSSGPPFGLASSRFFHHPLSASVSPASSSLAVASLTAQPSASSPSSSSSPLRPLLTPLRPSHGSSSLHFAHAAHALPTPSSFLTSPAAHFSFSPMSPRQHSASPTANTAASLLSPARDGGHLFSPSRFYSSPPRSTRHRRKRGRDQHAPVQPLTLLTEEEEDEVDDGADAHRVAQRHAQQQRPDSAEQRGASAAASARESSSGSRLRAAKAAEAAVHAVGAAKRARVKAEMRPAESIGRGPLSFAQPANGGTAPSLSLPATPLRGTAKAEPLFSPLDAFARLGGGGEGTSSLFSPLQTPQRGSASSLTRLFADTPAALSSLFSPAPHSSSPFASLFHAPHAAAAAGAGHGGLHFPSPSPFSGLTPATPERRSHSHRSAASPIRLLLPSPLAAGASEAQRERQHDGEATAAARSSSLPFSSSVSSGAGGGRPTSSPVRPRQLDGRGLATQSPSSAPNSPSVCAALFSPSTPLRAFPAASEFDFADPATAAADGPHEEPRPPLNHSRSDEPLAPPRPSLHAALLPATPITPAPGTSLPAPSPPNSALLAAPSRGWDEPRKPHANTRSHGTAAVVQ